MLGKGEISEAVSRRTGLRKSEASRAVDAILETMTDALKRGEEVRLTGFGTFKVTATKPRIGRNPRTGEQIRIPAGKRPSFSSGTRLVEAVKGGR